MLSEIFSQWVTIGGHNQKTLLSPMQTSQPELLPKEKGEKDPMMGVSRPFDWRISCKPIMEGGRVFTHRSPAKDSAGFSIPVVHKARP